MFDTVGISSEEVCCSVGFGTLVGVFVFSIMWSELLMSSAISCPLWSSVYTYQRVAYVLTSPVRTGCGVFVMYYMQCCMSISAVLYCVDVMSRGCTYMFAIVVCLVLLMCTLGISCSVWCVLMGKGMSVVVIVMLSQISVMSPPPVGTHGG